MRRRYIGFVACTVMLALILCQGCSASEESGQATQSSSDQTTQETTGSTELTGFAAPKEAEGYQVLGGIWEVAGITYDDKVIPIEAVDGLADLYDSVFLVFDSDGSFEYRLNVFVTRGRYVPYEGKDGTYLLIADTTCRQTIEDGEIAEIDTEESDKAYLVVTSADVENALGFAELDVSTGKMVDDDGPLYFTKSGEKSVFDDAASAGDESPSTDEKDSILSNSSNSNVYRSGNQRAVQCAQQYLEAMPFSYSGLVEQLEYEGFSHEDAVYGVDACGADWMEQAALKAKQYLQTMAFSESGLVDQLLYEGFTLEQAEYGVSVCGANWMEQAVKKAREYKDTLSMSYSQLVEQLEYEGFTHQQAVYGAENA